jgi:hypothetical protein
MAAEEGGSVQTPASVPEPPPRPEEVYVDHDGEVLVFVSLSGEGFVDRQGITERFFDSVELLDPPS